MIQMDCIDLNLSASISSLVVRVEGRSNGHFFSFIRCLFAFVRKSEFVVLHSTIKPKQYEMKTHKQAQSIFGDTTMYVILHRRLNLSFVRNVCM